MVDNVSDRILAELQSMRTRLDQIERQLRPGSTETSSVGKSPDLYQQAAQVKYAQSSQSVSTAAFTQTQPVKSKLGTGGFLGIVGILCFVLAASFFIELAIDSGWLTPFRQIVLSTMFGFSLIFTGYLLRDRDIPYLSMLPGSGVVVLFLSCYGAGFIYDLFNPPQTLLLISLTCVFSLVLYFLFHQVYYVLIAAIGAYLCPLLIDKASISLTEFMAIFLIWDITFAYLAVRLGKREITLIASYFALLVFFQQMFMGAAVENLPAVAWFQFLQFMIFFAGLIFQSIRHQLPLSSSESIAFFPLLILFYELEYVILNRISENLGATISLVFAGIILAVYLLVKKVIDKKNLSSEWMVYGFCSIVLYQSFYLKQQSSIHSPWFAILILLAVPALSKKIDLFKKHFLMVIVAFLILFWEYYKLIFKAHGISTPGFMEYLLLNMIFCGIVSSAYLFRGRKGAISFDDWTIVLFLAYAQALVGLSRFGLLLGESFSMAEGKKFIVSILWMIFAVVILMIGKIRKDAFFARSSLFVFGISICKVFFYDISHASSMVRILSLVVLGAVLYFGGYLYRHIETWEK